MTTLYFSRRQAARSVARLVGTSLKPVPCFVEVSGGRLTRQELGWLLAQEAKGAAKSLRAEVTELRASLRPPPLVASDESEDRISVTEMPAETSLKKLDEAIGLLSDLEAGPKRGRRGRVDLAALVYELAPQCRLAMEPGAGTEVFGDEGVLRRLLHMLLSQGPNPRSGPPGGAQQEASVRREGDWIRVSVQLGPDTSASSPVERRWLDQMTAKLGGRFELQGRTQSIVLAAEPSNQAQLDELKQELQQAQQLGEAYAKELAGMLDLDSAGVVAPATGPRHDAAGGELGGGNLSYCLRAVAQALLPSLEALLQAQPSEAAAVAAQVRDTTQELNRLAVLSDAPEARGVDLARVLRAAIDACEPRAANQGVTVSAELTDTALLNLNGSMLSALGHAVVNHAVDATPAGEHCTIRLQRDGAGDLLVLESEDAGSRLPSSAASELLELGADPASFGRPRGLGLLTIQAVCQAIGSAAHLTLTESENGRFTTRIQINATRSS